MGLVPLLTALLRQSAYLRHRRIRRRAAGRVRRRRRKVLVPAPHAVPIVRGRVQKVQRHGGIGRHREQIDGQCGGRDALSEPGDARERGDGRGGGGRVAEADRHCRGGERGQRRDQKLTRIIKYQETL